MKSLINKLTQGGPRLRGWRATLRFEEKFAGRKERNSIAIKRHVCCSNRPNFWCTPNVIFKFSVCLFATQNRDFLLAKRYTTHQQINNFFFGFGYEVNVHFNFRNRQKQVGMQVSSAILFRVSLFNRVILEKAFLQITNMGSTSSVQSLKRGQLPGCPLGCGPGYPSIISKLLP